MHRNLETTIQQTLLADLIERTLNAAPREREKRRKGEEEKRPNKLNVKANRVNKPQLLSGNVAIVCIVPTYFDPARTLACRRAHTGALALAQTGEHGRPSPNAAPHII